jgi:hypothetical protein
MSTMDVEMDAAPLDIENLLHQHRFVYPENRSETYLTGLCSCGKTREAFNRLDIWPTPFVYGRKVSPKVSRK